MIERSDLKEKPYSEIEELLQTELDNYKKEIESMTEIDELAKAEEELMEKFKEYDEYLKEVKYALPKDVEFDGEKYPRNLIVKMVIDFLSKDEVEWSYTLGMYELVRNWKDKTIDTVPYGMFDSTLRILGQRRYKGYSEWKDILIINKYFSQCHDDYSKDTAWNIFLSSMHDAILQRMELVRKQSGVIDETEVHSIGDKL